MRIIGIDPGTGILGFGVIDVHGGATRLVTAGVITTPAHTPIPERLGEIFDGLTSIIAETQPTMMAIEKLFFARNITTAMSVAEARGVALLTGQRAGLRIEEYTPLQIKQTITGYGKADKKASARDGAAPTRPSDGTQARRLCRCSRGSDYGSVYDAAELVSCCWAQLH